MKPIDLTPYKAAMDAFHDLPKGVPSLVDLGPTKGVWSIYYWNGLLNQCVSQFDDGRVVRYQEGDEDMLPTRDEDIEPTAWNEIFESLDEMIAIDIETEKANT